MSLRKYILVGAKVSSNEIKKYGYGGVLTLSNGLLDYAREIGVEVQVINTIQPADSDVAFLKRLKNGLSRIFELISCLQSEKRHGVVIFSGSGWSFYERIFLALICRFCRVKCIFFIVDGWFFNVQRKPFLMRILIGYLLRIPYKLAASGSNWEELYKDLGVAEKNIVTIRYWLPKSFAISEKPKVPRSGDMVDFVFVGWIVKEKGIYEILAALEILLKSYTFTFTFIGGGSLLETIRGKIEASRWESCVFAPGRLSSDQLDSVFSVANIFVLPSYAEGFPMSLIEAMSNGMPAICTDVGSISDSLHDGENGFLIPPYNVAALISAMEFYINRPDSIFNHSMVTLEVVKENHDANRNCRKMFDSFDLV